MHDTVEVSQVTLFVVPKSQLLGACLFADDICHFIFVTQCRRNLRLRTLTSENRAVCCEGHPRLSGVVQC